MSYLFTSESVSEGHPDKIADQISDAILDAFLCKDPKAKVACEVLVTTGLVVIAGEVKSEAYVDVQNIARETIRKIGYTKSAYQFDADSCGVISTIHEQSPNINQGVEQAEGALGAGDQGMMFGYANAETKEYMPLALALSHRLLRELADIRKEEPELMPYLRPDAKAQVTIRYNDQNEPEAIDTIVLSTQHDEFIAPKDSSPEAQKAADEAILAKIKDDIIKILVPRVKKQLLPELQKLFNDDIRFLINPTGKFVIGGPHGDAGLTGRKIIVDTYGGKGAHGGGAFSGKDPSKVDRSAAYATRHIAKNMVAAGVADEVLVQVAYAIGVAEPVGLFINTFGTAKVSQNGQKLNDHEIAKIISGIFDLSPAAIVKRLQLNNPIYSQTAAYGHMGRPVEKITYELDGKGGEYETFTWEKLDQVDSIKKAFQLD